MRTFDKLMRKAARRLLRGRPFVRAWPNPVEPPWPGKTTLTWDTGDGRGAIIAYVRKVNGEEELVPLTGAPSGSVDVDWIGPDQSFRFNLYDVEDWKRRDKRRPRPMAGTSVSMQRNERHEVLADLAVLGVAVGAVVLLALVCMKTLLAVFRFRG